MKIKIKDMTIEQFVNFCSDMSFCSYCPLSTLCYNCGASRLEALLYDPYLLSEVDLDESK